MQDLSSKTPLTLLAFGAHPDPFDMPYQAGGTLAKYAKRGHRVYYGSRNSRRRMGARSEGAGDAPWSGVALFEFYGYDP